MKRILATGGAVMVLGAGSVALGAIRGNGTKAIVLKPGQAITYAGLTCTTYAGTVPANANIVCVRNNLAGFGVVVSKQSIIIAKKAGSGVKVVFKTKNA
jgi:hypothetical protein